MKIIKLLFITLTLSIYSQFSWAANPLLVTAKNSQLSTKTDNAVTVEYIVKSNSPLTISKVELPKLGNGNMSNINDQCKGNPLYPGGQCSIKFDATYTQAQTATISGGVIEADGCYQKVFPNVTVNVNQRGGPILQVTTDQSNFAVQQNHPTNVVFKVKNIGDSPLSNIQITNPNGNGVEFGGRSGCTDTYNPGTSCTLTLQMTFKNTGTIEVSCGSVSAKDTSSTGLPKVTASVSPEPKGIMLITTPDISVPQNQAQDVVYTVRNGGTANLSNVAVKTLPNGNGVNLGSPKYIGCKAVIPNDSCTVTIPMTFTIAGNQPVTISGGQLQADGIEPADLPSFAATVTSLGIITTTPQTPINATQGELTTVNYMIKNTGTSAFNNLTIAANPNGDGVEVPSSDDSDCAAKMPLAANASCLLKLQMKFNNAEDTLVNGGLLTADNAENAIFSSFTAKVSPPARAQLQVTAAIDPLPAQVGVVKQVEFNVKNTGNTALTGLQVSTLPVGTGLSVGNPNIDANCNNLTQGNSCIVTLPMTFSFESQDIIVSGGQLSANNADTVNIPTFTAQVAAADKPAITITPPASLTAKKGQVITVEYGLENTGTANLTGLIVTGNPLGENVTIGTPDLTECNNREPIAPQAGCTIRVPMTFNQEGNTTVSGGTIKGTNADTASFGSFDTTVQPADVAAISVTLQSDNPLSAVEDDVKQIQYSLTNTGTANLNNVTVMPHPASDGVSIGEITNDCNNIIPGNSCTLTINMVFKTVGNNIAVSGGKVQGTDTAIVDLPAFNANVIAKDKAIIGISAPGTLVALRNQATTMNYTVTNNGTIALKDLTVSSNPNSEGLIESTYKYQNCRSENGIAPGDNCQLEFSFNFNKNGGFTLMGGKLSGTKADDSNMPSVAAHVYEDSAIECTDEREVRVGWQYGYITMKNCHCTNNPSTSFALTITTELAGSFPNWRWEYTSSLCLAPGQQTGWIGSSHSGGKCHYTVQCNDGKSLNFFTTEFQDWDSDWVTWCPVPDVGYKD